MTLIYLILSFHSFLHLNQLQNDLHLRGLVSLDVLFDILGFCNLFPVFYCNLLHVLVCLLSVLLPVLARMLLQRILLFFLISVILRWIKKKDRTIVWVQKKLKALRLLKPFINALPYGQKCIIARLRTSYSWDMRVLPKSTDIVALIHNACILRWAPVSPPRVRRIELRLIKRGY